MQQIFTQTMYDRFRLILNPYLKSRWNIKWKRSYVLYNAKGTGLIDVRDTVKAGERTGELVLQGIAYTFKDLDNDEKMRCVLRWVHDWITYKAEKKEYWQSAFETWDRKAGDCEDGAILIYRLAILAGVPEWRVKLCAGWVHDPNKKGTKSGHAYIIYLSELYNDWFVMDWCYWYGESLWNFQMTPHRELIKYKEIWWTTNHVYSWAQHDTIV
jgi:hypothetical protein